MPIRRSFYFIRHGETDWNKEQRFQGTMDIPLNNTGREQARLAAQNTFHLPIDMIVSSTLSRAYETAEIINSKLQKPLLTDKRLVEKAYGIFEGMEKTAREKWAEEAIKNNPNIAIEANGFPLPDGAEPYNEFKSRILDAINDYLSTYQHKNILFVAHAGVYRALHREIKGVMHQPENARPFLFDKDNDKWEIKKL